VDIKSHDRVEEPRRYIGVHLNVSGVLLPRDEAALSS
jgi:hypothetical protein